MTATILLSEQPKERPVRASASHTPKWQRYQHTLIESTSDKKSTTSVGSKDKETYAYQKQYSHVYSHRLASLKGRCWDALRQVMVGSGPDTPKEVKRVLELQEDVLSHIVGAIVKETSDPKEDTVLLLQGYKAAAEEKNDCRPSDQLYLEDESGRVALLLDPPHQVHEFCTGVVAGVEGTVDAKGNLHVRHVVPPVSSTSSYSSDNKNGTSNTSDSLTVSEPTGQDPHLLLVSSLQCGDPSVGTVQREMLVSYLQGHFAEDAAKVCRVVLAGSGPSSVSPLDGLKELDLVIGRQISGANGCSIPVDVMPSGTDPTTRNWPQRPLHSSLLPSCTKPMVHTTPNPYAAVHGTQLVVGTDGLNVRDLQQHTLRPSDVITPNNSSNGKKENDGECGVAVGDDTQSSPSGLVTSPSPPVFRTLTELEALERTLQWSNICPTAPDSVGAVPTTDFVLTETPQLYFCGNCEEGFATKITTTTTTKTRLVCIPKFHETGEAVLVNLRTLDVELLRFQDEEEEQ